MRARSFLLLATMTMDETAQASPRGVQSPISHCVDYEIPQKNPRRWYWGIFQISTSSLGSTGMAAASGDEDFSFPL